MKLMGSMIRGACSFGVFGFAFYGASTIGLWAVVLVLVMCILGTDTDIWGYPKDRR